MEHPVKVAFCPILFGATGGRFTPLGKPIFDRNDEVPPNALCDTAYDCGLCPHMQKWLEARAQEDLFISWECDKCIKETSKIERTLPGFYHSGMGEMDEDNPKLDGCTRCGHPTPFLQLVLRKERAPDGRCICEGCEEKQSKDHAR